MAQSVFFFGNGTAEGTRDMTSVLGGKGANLAEMTNLGVPVPSGFTIACNACIEFLSTGTFNPSLREQVGAAMRRAARSFSPSARYRYRCCASRENATSHTAPSPRESRCV